MNTKKENINSKYFSLGIALLACTLIFIAIEIKYPFFFMRDDNADSYIAEYAYGIRCIAEGKFPFYCFNEFCGQRFFAFGQTGLLNPIILFAAILSNILCGKFDMMIEIIVFISILIGSSGAFFLLKKIGCSDLPAIVGSIAWSFYAYNIWVGSCWIAVIYTTSVFPYFLLTSLRLLEKSSIRNIVLMVIPRLYLFYLGHPQFFIFAALFDCIFIGVLCLIKNKGDRLRKLLHLIRDYLLVYISTAFLALPLLVPEYQFTTLTYGYGSARSYDNLMLEMWIQLPDFFVPFLYDENNYSFFFPPFIGYLLEICLFVGFILIIFPFTNKAFEKYKTIVKMMIAVLPCLIISYLILFNYDTLRIISFIPILNRFQYYHRITIYLSAFMIMFACLSMTMLGSILGKKYAKLFSKNKRLAYIGKAFIICLEIMCFSFLYACTPHMGRGPLFNTNEQLYDYEFAKQLSGGRYVLCGYGYNPENINKDIINLSENLGYNMAKYYGINNVSGYYCDLNYYDVIQYNECFDLMYGIEGSVVCGYPDLIEQMREQSVCWYIVSSDSLYLFEEYFDYYGLKYISETEHSIVYYDPYSQPYAYDVNGNEVSLKQDVNSLFLETDSCFPGGKITLNYSYDPNFKCYIDGKPTEIINEPMNWQYHIECTPGEHDIVIRYEDFTFYICCIITCEFIVFSLLMVALYSKLSARDKEPDYYQM